MSGRTDREYHSAHREVYHARTDKILARILKACDGMSVYRADFSSVENEVQFVFALGYAMHVQGGFELSWKIFEETVRGLETLGSSGVLLQIRPDEDRIELWLWSRLMTTLREIAAEWEKRHGKKLVVVFYPETSTGSRLAVVIGGTKLVRPPKR